MSDLETREVCSDSTHLDISYATVYEGHLPRYVRYDIWKFLKIQLRFVLSNIPLRSLGILNTVIDGQTIQCEVSQHVLYLRDIIYLL